MGSFRYICDKIHSKWEQKTPTKYVENFRYGSYEPSRKSSRGITLGRTQKIL